MPVCAFTLLNTMSFNPKMMSLEIPLEKVPEPFEPTDWSDIDDILCQIGRHCIKNNLFRQGNDFHQIDVDVISKARVGPPTTFVLEGCYAFLDEPNEPCGMIRMWGDQDGDECNPKWSFWEEDGVVKVDYC